MKSNKVLLGPKIDNVLTKPRVDLPALESVVRQQGRSCPHWFGTSSSASAGEAADA